MAQGEWIRLERRKFRCNVASRQHRKCCTKQKQLRRGELNQRQERAT